MFMQCFNWSNSSNFREIHSSNVRRSLKSQKFTETLILGVQGRSKSSMSVVRKTRQHCLL